MYLRITDLADSLQEIVGNRLCGLQAEVAGQDEEVQALFRAFQRELMSSEDSEEDFLVLLYRFLNPESVRCMEDMMAGAVGRFVRFVLTDEYFKLFNQFLQVEQRCAFYVQYNYVPYGGRRPMLHLNAIEYAIKDFFVLEATGWDEERLLFSCVVEDCQLDDDEVLLPDTFNVISEWLTVKLASGDRAIADFMLEELDEEDYSDVSAQLFVTSVLKSGNLRLLKTIVNLMLHQDDYLETLVSDVFKQGMGIAPESMLFLLDMIRESRELRDILELQLYRMLFPKRDMGLNEESYADILSLAAECLRSGELRQQMLADPDPHKVYVALWAIGFYDSDECWNAANELIGDGRPLSKDVVLAYYQNHLSKQGLEVITQRIDPQ